MVMGSFALKGHSSVNTSLAKKLQNRVLILAEKIIFPKTQYSDPYEPVLFDVMSSYGLWKDEII